MKLDYISDARFRRSGRAMTMAMAQQTQEPARWLSAKSRNKNRATKKYNSNIVPSQAIGFNQNKKVTK